MELQRQIKGKIKDESLSSVIQERKERLHDRTLYSEKVGNSVVDDNHLSLKLVETLNHQTCLSIHF